MSTHRRSHMRFVQLLSSILVLTLALAFVLPGGAAQAAQGGGGGLSKHDRELLAQARAQGAPTVTLLIASKPGANKTVINGIKGLGGTVGYENGDISYVRATVPTNKVEAAAQLNGVQSARSQRSHPT